MPSAPLRYCSVPNCPNKVPSGRCQKHQRIVRQAERRFQNGATAYNSARWVRESKAFRAAHPFCVNAYTEDTRCTVLTALVDHRIPHRGDERLFWDQSNWQPMCWYCHGIKSEREMLSRDAEIRSCP
jgi:5-methylcytosine-specific restriction enzyme A